jgi:hypothetical protein
MFYITAETCRRFTLAEILIMAAMNVETFRLDSAFAIPGRGRKHWLLSTAPDPKAGAALSSQLQRSTGHARPYTCHCFQESAPAA